MAKKKKKIHRNALPDGYELHWYRIEDVLGYGGFGITYLARDINLDRPVAIKEYMPTQICIREENQDIVPISKDVEEDYQWGLKRFVSEARTLTKFEHPNLVRVFSVFETNNSAYMVMSYEVGRNLKLILRSGKKFSEHELLNLMLPLMDGLEAVHNVGFVHRDIKPGNIFIRNDGRPLLIDFGSARQTRGRSNTQTLTNFVSPGYAPIEQYSSKSDRQGPWTDIYGMGATIYEVMTGSMPEPSIDRSVMISNDAGDNLISASMRCKGKYSEEFLAAIDHALGFNIQQRPQSIAEWRNEFPLEGVKIENLEIPPDPREMRDKTTLPMESPAGEDEDNQKNAAFRTRPNTKPEPGTQTGPEETRTEQDISTETGTTVKRTDFEDSEDTTVAVNLYESTTTVSTTRQHHKTSPVLLVILLVSLIIAAVHMSYRYPEQSPDERANTAVSGFPVESLTEVVPDDFIPRKKIPVVIIPAEPTTEEKIAGLLAQAEEDLRSLRLTTPESSNAYDKYMAVLELDEDNANAIRGFDLISDKYLQFVTTDIQEANFERAEYYLQKAEEVSPDAPKVEIARDALEAAITEHNRPRTFMEKMKDLFR